MKKFTSKFNIFLSAVLLLGVTFSVVINKVHAVTPNPGHPWSEVGDGVFSVTGPTTMRTFTFPDSDASVMTGNGITKGGIITGTGAGTFGVTSVGGNGQVLSADSTQPGGVKWINSGVNLTGPITSSGGVTSVASQTGSGSKFVMDTSPTLITPNIGNATATGITLSSITGSVQCLHVNSSGVISGTNSDCGSSGGGGTPPGGSNTQVQYNSGGTFAGITGATTDGTTLTLVAPVLGAATATSINKVSITAPATGSTLTIADGKTLTASNTLTFTGSDSASVAFGNGGTVLYNGGALGTPASGVATNLTGTASGLTAGNVTTDANLTGPITSSGNATSIASQTGTGSTFVMQASPILTTPNIGVATATTINGNTISTGSGTLTLGAGKTLTANNSLTFSGTDGSTLNIGTGGALGTNAYTSTAYAPIASPTFTGTVTIPSGSNLNTPSTIVGTNITGTAAGLTAGTVTTDANLTGVITSSGNATSLGSFSSANLSGALTDETGSGVAVFGTTPTLSGFTMADGTNIILNTTTGTRIGTATNQKLGFFNSSPIAQPSGDVLTALSNLGLISSPTLSVSDVSGAAASGTNTDITSVLLNQTGLVIKGASANALTIKPNETLSAPRTLNIVTGDANRTLTFAGDATISGTNTGDNAVNSNYVNDYRAANFVAGTDYLTPTGSAAALTSFPTFNQNTTGNAATATALQTARNIGGVSFNGTADITVATATGGFTVSGGDLALGANNLTMTGSLGSNASRLTKGWFTDLQVTNAINGSITGNAGTVTGLSVTGGKTLTVSNSLTLAGADSSTLNIGTGGTLGTAAYTASSAYEVPLTFSTGLTRSTNTITNNLAVGVSGGQSVIGGTGVTDVLSLKGTTGNGTLTSPAIQTLVGNNGATVASTILNNGNIGIGTATPIAKLDVSEDGTTPNSALYNSVDPIVMSNNAANTVERLITASTGGTNSGFLTFLSTRGTLASPLSSASGDTLGNVNIQGYDGATRLSAASILGAVDGAVSTGVVPGRLVFNTTNTSGTLTERMRITDAGNVGIGTNSPGALLDIGLAGTTLGTMRLEGNSSGYTQIQPSASAGSWTMTLPTGTGSNGQVLTTNGSGVTSWTTVSGGGGGLTVGTSTITGGSSGNVEYNNGGVLGEMTTSGSGTVLALATSPSIATPTITGSTITMTDAAKTLSIKSNTAAALAISDGTNNYLTIDTRNTNSGSSAFIFTPGTAPTIASASGAQYIAGTFTPGTYNFTGTTNLTGTGTSAPLGILVNQPTINGNNTNTIAEASNFLINGPAKATSSSGTETLTNSYGLNILAGSALNGSGGAVSNGFGLSVNAPSGATKNYAAEFLGGNVGIGTSSPTSLLSVIGTAGSNGATGTAATQVLVITGGAGGNSTGATTAGAAGAAINITAGAGGNSTGVAGANGATITLQTGAGGTGSTTGSYGSLILNSSGGNVGVGTASPSTKFYVSGGSTLDASGIVNTGSFAADSSINTSTISSVPVAILANINNTAGNIVSLNFRQENVTPSLRDAAAIQASLSTTTAGSEAGFLRFDTEDSGTLTEQMRITPTGQVGIGTTSPGSILAIGSSDLGSGAAGPVITLGINSDATPGAGSINFENKSATSGFVWQDATGLLRINSSAPTNANDTAGTVVGLQSSSLSSKNVIGEFTDYESALQTIVNAPVYNFTYKSGAYNDEQFTGIITDYSPTFGMDPDATHPDGKSLNVINGIGYTFSAIKELNLNLNGIAGTATPLPGSASDNFVTAFFENIKAKITTWLADAGNGIGKLFANEVDTKTLCVSDDSGAKTCITKAQLDALISNSGSSVVNNTGGGIATPPSPTPDNSTSTDPASSSDSITPTESTLPPDTSTPPANPPTTPASTPDSSMAPTPDNSTSTDPTTPPDATNVTPPAQTPDPTTPASTPDPSMTPTPDNSTSTQ